MSLLTVNNVKRNMFGNYRLLIHLQTNTFFWNCNEKSKLRHIEKTRNNFQTRWNLFVFARKIFSIPTSSILIIAIQCTPVDRTIVIWSHSSRHWTIKFDISSKAFYPHITGSQSFRWCFSPILFGIPIDWVCCFNTTTVTTILHQQFCSCL